MFGRSAATVFSDGEFGFVQRFDEMILGHSLQTNTKPALLNHMVVPQSK